MTMNLYSNSTHDLSDKSEVQSKFSRRLVGKAQPLNRTTPSSLFFRPSITLVTRFRILYAL
jgi:hypothetical protein